MKTGRSILGRIYVQLNWKRPGRVSVLSFLLLLFLRKLRSLSNVVYIYASCFYLDDCNVSAVKCVRVSSVKAAYSIIISK